MKLYWSALALVFLGACAAPPPPAVPTPATTPPPAPTPNSGAGESKPIALVAHRGGAGLAPENTLASFRKGLELGADYLEMDVHLTKDGIPVVIHDPTVDRTTDGEGRVGDMTLEQLQAFNAAAKFPGGPASAGGGAGKEPVPTLAQVLDLAKGTSVRLEIEIKVAADNRPYPGIEQKVLDEVARRGMLDRVRIMAFEFDTLKQVKALNPRVQTVALMTTDYFRGKDVNAPAAMVDDVASFANGIGVNKDLLTAQLTREAQNRRMLVGVWTVDGDAEIKKFIDMGVDSITSNRPDLLKQALGR
jgi:glycerophosphoryl diester phosphodiesterase